MYLQFSTGNYCIAGEKCRNFRTFSTIDILYYWWTFRTLEILYHGFSYHPQTFYTIHTVDFSYHHWTFHTVVHKLVTSFGRAMRTAIIALLPFNLRMLSHSQRVKICRYNGEVWKWIMLVCARQHENALVPSGTKQRNPLSPPLVLQFFMPQVITSLCAFIPTRPCIPVPSHYHRW